VPYKTIVVNTFYLLYRKTITQIGRD